MKGGSVSIWLIRLITASTLGIFLWRACHQWLEQPSLTLTLVIAGELVTLSIYLSARMSKHAKIRPIALVSTLFGTFFFYFVVLEQGQVLTPIWISAFLQIFGIVWQIASKLSLGRSFGLLPANRGVVTRGTYRVVRHPIYLGYLIGHTGFLLASFSWYNLLLFMAMYFFQGLRVWEEERLLKDDPTYREYMLRTRYRLVPGII